ncbi:homeobox protein H17-like [Arctopsyche grandis]|uniref:homeobox protein H17-like n=1 Tax=Arctopsyche grandis TaxID=121162 RepID=UPI00406D904B
MDYERSDYQPYTFQWLNCTRYHPPKLPRPYKKETAKRQPGRHPRIPFTALQIETLEKSYKNSQYLCPDEIVKLSQQLDLSDTRIKIWFQNRRAREKREKDSSSQYSKSEERSHTI